ncbi:MAG: transposase [Planctomycetes bacterium]|nr:transposase [Planctomycetota bacterium]
MANPPRVDEPGSWHHVMNRGVARRTIFETHADMRFLFSRIAREARKARIEVHAYSVLPNHFHFLLRSLTGEMSAAVGWIENQYAHWFNRRRERDGPVFRGRFRSRRVQDRSDLLTVVCYIDRNCVDAGIVDAVQNYPYGSARYYIAGGSGPRWLVRDVVLDLVREVSWGAESAGDAYATLMGRPLTASQRHTIERELVNRRAVKPRFEDLVNSAPPAIRATMHHRIANADGRAHPRRVIAPETVLCAIERFRELEGEWSIRTNRRSGCGWSILACGLLRAACRLTLQEVARRAGVSVSTAFRRVRDHEVLCARDDRYCLRTLAVSEKIAPGAIFSDRGV